MTPELPPKEILRGTNVTIDMVFVRHAEREAVDPEMLRSRKSPSLTEAGLQNAMAWGRTVLHSDLFYNGQYDYIHFTGTATPRTHQTAEAIIQGASLSSHVYASFPQSRGSGIDTVLRVRPDGKHWDNDKIVAAGQKTLAPDTPLTQELSALCTHQQTK